MITVLNTKGGAKKLPLLSICHFGFTVRLDTWFYVKNKGLAHTREPFIKGNYSVPPSKTAQFFWKNEYLCKKS